VTYRCEIIDAGDRPMFQITQGDMEPIVETSPTRAWSVIVQKVNSFRARGTKRTSSSVSGPEYMGYAHPYVAALLQDMPNADKLTKYIRIPFVVTARKPPKAGSRKKAKIGVDEDDDDDDDDDEGVAAPMDSVPSALMLDEVVEEPWRLEPVAPPTTTTETGTFTGEPVAAPFSDVATGVNHNELEVQHVKRDPVRDEIDDAPLESALKRQTVPENNLE
jgi:hypothetical protein